jgi:ABC-type bacteriocin/lantibiotic exporter with double-glycine peptidase domain
VVNEVKWCAIDVLSVALTWGLVIAYVWQVRRSGDALLIGSVFMVHQYATQARGVITTMATSFSQFARTRTDVASAEPIWNAPQRTTDSAEVARGWQRIEFEGLSYSHGAPGAAESHSRGGLQQVSLAIRRGERIALVGPSGAGKSTLLRLLAGLYRADQVRIAIDGHVQSGLRHLGSIATLIPQEAEVFEASVAENIAFSEDADTVRLQTAVHASAFDTVLHSLPDGTATLLSERGMNLSGGQRQRLCLARGVFAAEGSSVLLLDEPTSALDPLTEAEVHQRLKACFPDAAIIASVHRMSLLAHFDTVVLMAGGRVVDAGTPSELCTRQPVFAAMLGDTKRATEAQPLPA